MGLCTFIQHIIEILDDNKTLIELFVAVIQSFLPLHLLLEHIVQIGMRLGQLCLHLLDNFLNLVLIAVDELFVRV